MLRIIHFQETLHKHDTEEVEKVDMVKGETSMSLPIPGSMSRSGSRKYSVCEGIESPALISPFGSFHDSKYEDDLQHAERRSQTFDRTQSRSNSLRSRQDNEEEYTDACDGYDKDLPVMDTAKDSQGDAYNFSVIEGKAGDKTASYISYLDLI